MGYHKVGNPDSTLPAVTLHLYCPPFQKCKIWMNPNTLKGSNACMCYYSEYGVRLDEKKKCDEDLFEVVTI
jgi:cysteine dioxygenase